MCLDSTGGRTSWLRFLWTSPPGADVSLTARHHPPLSRTSLPSVSVFFVAVGISMNIGKARASTSSSYAGLCKRERPGRFRCGDHGVKGIAFNAAGTHRVGSWRRRTARLPVTPAAVPTRCSLLSVCRPNQRTVTLGAEAGW